MSVIGGDLIRIPHELDVWAEVNARGGLVGLSLKDHLWGPILVSSVLLIKSAGEGGEDAQPSLETYALHPQSLLPSPVPTSSSWHIRVTGTPLCAQYITVYMVFSHPFFLPEETDKSNYSCHPTFTDEKPKETQLGSSKARE